MNKKIMVLGAGTAGCAAAIFLRQHGHEVLLTDRARPGVTEEPTIGESLSPDAAPLLRQLGIWEAFCQASHLKCYGNVSYWHSDTAMHHDFLQHPIGHGWHLDRSQFDAQLLEKALQMGVDFYPETTVSQLSHANGQWLVSLSSSTGNKLDTMVDFAVDATGRNSWLARQQGIERLFESEQLALVAFLDITSEFEDSRTMVETTTDGWWYSAAIPDNRMVTAFFCSPHHPERNAWTNPKNWQTLVNQAPHTAERLTQSQGVLSTPPKYVAAHGSILERLQGPGWVAIGDAALTYDPIAAHGITMAMTSARDAAQAIDRAFTGDRQGLEHYEAVLWAAFQRYAEERGQFASQ